RVAALRGARLHRQQRADRRPRGEGHVGVPEVGAGQRLRRVEYEYLAVRSLRRVLAGVIVPLRRGGQLAEDRAERDVLVVIETESREEQHEVLVPRGAQLTNRVVVELTRHIKALDRGAEHLR